MTPLPWVTANDCIWLGNWSRFRITSEGMQTISVKTGHILSCRHLRKGNGPARNVLEILNPMDSELTCKGYNPVFMTIFRSTDSRNLFPPNPLHAPQLPSEYFNLNLQQRAGGSTHSRSLLFRPLLSRTSSCRGLAGRTLCYV